MHIFKSCHKLGRVVSVAEGIEYEYEVTLILALT